MTATFKPRAFANLTARWPSPPRQTTPKCMSGLSSLKYLKGPYTVIPPQRRGAATPIHAILITPPLKKGKLRYLSKLLFKRMFKEKIHVKSQK